MLYIEPEMIQVQFKDILFNRCLGGRVVKGAGILRVGLVLWVQYPVKAIFFCWFWYPVMSILYKNDRNVRSDNWEKTRLSVFIFYSINLLHYKLFSLCGLSITHTFKQSGTFFFFNRDTHSSIQVFDECTLSTMLGF